MTYAEAVTRLADASRMPRADVERDPTWAAEVAGANAIECRNVIRAQALARRDGLT